MKILFLSSYFYPEQAASHYLSDNRFHAFADDGIEMVNFVPTPCRGVSEEVRRKYKKIKNENLYNSKMSLHRFSMFKEPKNPVGRAFRYTLCCMKQLYHGLKEKNVDVLFLSSTPPIMGLVGGIIKKWKKIPFIYNLQDIFPDSLITTGLAKRNGILWKFGRIIENFTYRNADKIIVISQDFKRNIMAKGVPEDKIEVVYNWVDQNAVINVDRSRNKLIDVYGLPKDKFYVTYAGNIGLTQNLDLLLEVAKELKNHRDIYFVLIGNGAYKVKVEQIIEKENIKNVSILPLQPYEDISHVFSLGNVGVVISKPGVGSNSVPSKTWSILSASRPVIANFDPNELKNIIEDNECGIFTTAGDKEAFIKAILFLHDNPEKCERYGRNGRKFIEQNLTKEVGTSKLVKIVRQFDKSNI